MTSLIHSLCFILLLLCLNGNIVAQIQVSDCRKVEKLRKTMEEEHFSPVKFTNEVSSELFEEYLAGLDADGLIFIQADIDALEIFRLKLDDEILGGECKFIPAVAKVYQNALNRADSIARGLLSQPFDLTLSETLRLEKSGDLHPSANIGAQVTAWSHYLKYRILNRLMIPADSSEDPLEIKAEVLLAREAEAREYVKKRIARSHRRLLEPEGGFEKNLFSSYLNAITSLYDPHSEYFSITEKVRFDAMVSNQNYAFGFSLTETKAGDFKVTRIKPGGAAWRTNALHEGDILIRCIIPGQSAPDLSDIDLRDFESKIGELTVHTITLTVRKSDGRHKTTTLRKEKVRDDDGAVRGLMLEGSSKVGYIALPGFYAASESDPQSGCGNDVAREVIKLKREGMTGLILDLRNNGGGSVNEAAELAGIFLDYGPLFQRRVQDQDVHSVKDPNRGYAWKGSMVVLVNGLSASASELVSGALQDYHRAVIVGSSTFGKSSGQIVVPIPGNSDFVKVTSSKFNRINGDSYQLTGIQPDIQVPDVFSGLDYKEASYPHTLPPDKIEPNKYFTPGNKLPLDALRSNSLDRIDNDNRFVRFSMFSESISKMLHYPLEIPLEINAFRKYESNRSSLMEEWEGVFDAKNSNFKVRVAESDRELVEADAVRKETYQALIDKISKDFIVEEGFHIIEDLNQ
jgi:carboxyl-terminal processing protease